MCDYVASMAKRFEEDKGPLKRDQALFVAQFAHACNTVYDEDLKAVLTNIGINTSGIIRQ